MIIFVLLAMKYKCKCFTFQDFELSPFHTIQYNTIPHLFVNLILELKTLFIFQLHSSINSCISAVASLAMTKKNIKCVNIIFETFTIHDFE